MKAHVAAMGAGLGLLACGPDDGATSEDPAENVIMSSLRVLPADVAYEGRDLQAWATEFMRWHYSWTSPQCFNAENDGDGSRCGFNQPDDSPVFFLASADYSRTPDTVVSRRECKVPEGKAILVPISFFGDDDAGLDESERRAPEQIEDNVDEVHETMRGLILIADQKPVEDLSGYSIAPTAFDYQVGARPNWHSCNGYNDVEDTTVSPSYFAGYFALIEPPTRGKHQLEYGAVYSYYDRDYFRRVDTVFEVTDE